MSTTEFTIAYDGEALKDHRIDVRDLAAALLAIGNLFEETNRAVNREQAETRVHVRGTAGGSFQVVLDVVQTLASHAEGLLTGHHVDAAKDLKTLVFGDGGLMALLLFLKGRRPKQIQSESQDVFLQVDGETSVFSQQVTQLAESVAVRREVANLLSPLRRPGIDRLEASDRPGSVPTTTIDKSDVDFFDLPTRQEVIEALPDRTWTQAYSIVSLAFKEENQWRLSDGHSPIGVTISDHAFLARVDAGLSFSKGDVLVCDIKSRQSHTSDGLRTDYEVVRIVEHRPTPNHYKLIRD